jgi:dTDP-4-amino-4,6-dideoxygalactose transaminase
MTGIEMVDLRNEYAKLKPRIDAAIHEVLDSTAFVKGPATQGFEKNLAAFQNVKHVIGCGNGTDALQIAMMALGLQPGDEVITPTFTYIATVEVVALLGYKPVFVEVDSDTFTLNIEQLKAAITPKTKCIIPVHLYGMCANMEAILEIANHHGIPVVEDNAQSIGSEVTFSNGEKKKAGTMGNAGTFSFYPTKNLGAYGDGGALCTNDDSLAEKIKMISNHGQKVTYFFDVVGVNSRLDSIQAAILNEKLKELDSFTHLRQNAATYYNQFFAGNEHIITPKVASYSTHVFHQYTIRVKKRDALKEYLKENGIPSMIYYPKPAHLQAAYLQYGYKKGDFPISEQLCEEVISLPMHTQLTTEQQDYIAEKVIAFYNH